MPRLFREYVRRLYDARHDARDTMIHGRFVDTVGLECAPPELYAKAYASLPGHPPAISVVVINRNRQDARPADVAILPASLRARRPEFAHLPQDAAAWQWRETLLEAHAQGTGARARIEIPPNRVALIRFVAP